MNGFAFDQYIIHDEKACCSTSHGLSNALEELVCTKERLSLQEIFAGTGLAEDDGAVNGNGYIKEGSCGKRWEGGDKPCMTTGK